MFNTDILMETCRLRFRPWAESDAEVLYKYASGRVMAKCGFRDTGEVNWLSQLYRGGERPVKVMRLDYAL